MSFSNYLDEFCYPLSPFWRRGEDENQGLVENSSVIHTHDRIDLTLCFQDTAILYGICLSFWFLSAAIVMCGSRMKPSLPLKWLHVTKIILCFFILMLPLCDVVHSIIKSIKDGGDVAKYYFLSPVVLFITMIIVIMFMVSERKRGERSSGLLILFWLMLVLYCVMKSRTLILISEDNEVISGKFHFATFFVQFGLFILQFILSLIQEPKSPYHFTGDRKPCPEESAPFFSRITWWWHSNFIWRGYKSPFNYDRLNDLNNNDKSRVVSPKFQSEWEKQLKKDNGCHLSRGPSLLNALIRSYGFKLFIAGFFKLGQDLLAFVSPLILKLLITYVKDKDEPVWKGYVYTAVMFTCAVIQSLLLQQYYHYCYVSGMRIRTGIIAAVYKKSLTLSSKSRQDKTVGEIVNLMSVDAQRFMDVTNYIHLIWSAPFQILVALLLLYLSMGVSVFAGFGVMLLFIPLNMFTGSLIRRFQILQMIKKDLRIKIVNEVLNGIKVIKMYAWELPFQHYIMKIRKEEVNVLRKSAYINASVSFTWSCAPFMVALATFTTYTLINRNSTDPNDRLTAEKAFVALSLFNILRFPLSMSPMLISSLIEASVSLKRLSSFLQTEEIDPNNVNRMDNPAYGDEESVSIKGGTFTWDRPEKPILKNINFSVKAGELVAVVGPVGSGKSSLISSLLGEMNKVKGVVTVKGRVAYVPQLAWIQNATVKDNILFGRQFNYMLYRQTLQACALEADLEILPGGDLTEIGEKGINLSGGQKQRVSLARAIYQESDVFLLDDPLSAVDSHVGKHIFDKVIGPEGVLKGKARILVTHGIGFLSQCDKIIVMNNGCITEVGTYNELVEQNGAFAEFLHNYSNSEEENQSCSLHPTHNNSLPRSLPRSIPPSLPRSLPPSLPLSPSFPLFPSVPFFPSLPLFPSLPPSLPLSVSHMQGHAHSSNEVEVYDPFDGPMEHTDNVSELVSPVAKLRDTGRHSALDIQFTFDGASDDEESNDLESSSRLFNSSLKKGNSHSDLRRSLSKQSILSEGRRGRDQATVNKRSRLIGEEAVETGNVKLSVFFQYAKACSLYISFFILFLNFLSDGTSVSQNLWLAHWSNEEEHANTSNLLLNLGVYSALGVLQGIMVVLAAFSLYFGALNASIRLHNKMLRNILRAPMSFFDTTPLGRILNRFSKDVYTIDEAIPRSLRAFLITIFPVLSTMLVVAVASPWFLVVVAPLLIVYIFIQRYYVATSRQLKRLESSSRSPIYSHFQESINGATSIRAYSKVDQFQLQSEAKVDYNQIAYYPTICADRWLAVRLEFLGNLVILSASLFAVLQRNYSSLFGSISPGIAGLSISYAIQVTQELNWVVRMTSELETNIVAVERTKEYSEVSNEAPSVIPDRCVPPGWPVEGRVQFDHYSTRYRPGMDLVLNNISCDIPGGQKVGIVGRTGAGKSSLTVALFRIIESAHGRILIDGRDISTYGLNDIRSHLTIIPQDPVLFSGTLRINLDPFNAHSDDELWISLKTAHLNEFVDTVIEGLEYPIAEGGENLSVGQRQLVCLARALLRKTKILILDEATAAVDMETDDLIQQTIRKEFSDCTILTIAHRLHTIMDYDKIMVLDAGHLKEFDSPSNLIKCRGIFYKMAEDAGLV